MPRQGVMLAYKYDERRLRKWKPPWIVQPKFNGERCRAIVFRLGVNLFSSGAKGMNSVPHIKVQLQKAFLEYKGPLPVELDGELYKHGMLVDKIHSRARRTVNLHEDHEALDYHIFDVISSDPQYKRLELLDSLRPALELQPSLYVSQTWEVATQLDIERFYNRCLNNGFEGLIFRNADAPYIRAKTPMLMKLKPRELGEFTIIGIKEEISIEGIPKNSLGAFHCKTKDGEKFKVGSGPFLTQERRIKIWEAYKEGVIFLAMLTSHELRAEIKYDELTPRGVPRFPSLIGVTSAEV